jgi:hypothetical protein
MHNTATARVDLSALVDNLAVVVAVGDEAVLWGGELPATQVAEHAQTINYALYVALGQRVSREYASARRMLPASLPAGDGVTR